VAGSETAPPDARQIEYIGEEKARGTARSSRLKVESPEQLGIFDPKLKESEESPAPTLSGQAPR